MNDPTTQAQRTGALRDLVQRRVPVPQALAALTDFAWDSDTELVTLTRADAVRSLRDHLDGTLTDRDLQSWADALEVRDDIGREPGYEDQLTEFLFEIATPEVAGPLTPERATHWIQTFQAPTAGT
ncbi:hypothetical protein [Amycolatopsis panacis]|uniref:Uncharacterized protein n=1 Tax=Amycolatopsis panacis TaxID=2340917 RepID=A0A419HWJ3_9PSEU|nr:hypothetical protein [Amycolatopsis panacis]RJQ81374.1 hypothetical protein D5S19_23675 [Amycolatopsis panacis]